MSKKPKKRKHRRPSKQARRDKTPKVKEDVVYLDFESFERKLPWRCVQDLVFFDIKTSSKPSNYYSLQASLYQSTTSQTAPKHALYRLLDEKGQPLLPREKDEQ